ncbi:MAG: hypothetical protein ACE5RA_01005 [Nitrosopumilus sp.]|nr:hypothetical protein [Nitrosopumilus sp.]
MMNTFFGLRFDMLEYKILLGFALFLIATISISPQIYAQTNDSVYTSEQTTVSENLENDPMAQMILKKIEQTKKWIAELEEKNYEQLADQRELESIRQQALESLNRDYNGWMKLWEEYSPRNSFERFVEKKPEFVQEIFWDQFEFHENKVNAGRAAYDEILSNKGTMGEARQAYLKAAETKYIELIAENSKINVKHNRAIYEQQLLFTPQGQFIETPTTGEELRKFFEDYRTNPEYLKANPDDSLSWDKMVRQIPTDECREGLVLIYRYQSSDNVCVSETTAQMWERYRMGQIKN